MYGTQYCFVLCQQCRLQQYGLEGLKEGGGGCVVLSAGGRFGKWHCTATQCCPFTRTVGSTLCLGRQRADGPFCNNHWPVRLCFVTH